MNLETPGKKEKNKSDGPLYIVLAIVLIFCVWSLPYIDDIAKGKEIPFLKSLGNLNMWPFNNRKDTNKDSDEAINYKTLDCKVTTDEDGVKNTSEVIAYYIDEINPNEKATVKYYLEPSVATDTSSFESMKALTNDMLSPLKDFKGFTYTYDLGTTFSVMQLDIDYTKIDATQLTLYNESSLSFNYAYYQGIKTELKSTLEAQNYTCE